MRRSGDRPKRDRGILTHRFLLLRFGWVLAAVASTGWLGFWQSFKVGVARKAAKIQYPQSEYAYSGVSLLEFTRLHDLAYAEKAEVEKSEAALRFNCAQRELLDTHVFIQKLTHRLQAPIRIPSRASHMSCQCQSSGLNGPSCVNSRLSRCRGLIWGLKQPVYSAIALEFWVLGRIWYTRGYINNGPSGVRTSDHHDSDLIAHVLSFPLF